MAEFHELAHFHIGDRPVLTAISRYKPMNSSFHTAHGTLFHGPAASTGACGHCGHLTRRLRLTLRRAIRPSRTVPTVGPTRTDCKTTRIIIVDQLILAFLGAARHLLIGNVRQSVNTAKTMPLLGSARLVARGEGDYNAAQHQGRETHGSPVPEQQFPTPERPI